MNHLTERELSSVLDGALRGEKLWRAQQHMERCGVCRDAFQTLTAEDAALRASLGRVPDEDYFDKFADRVFDRLDTAKQIGLKIEMDEALQSPFGDVWWRTPRTVALVATLTAVVAAAGIVTILANRADLPILDSKAHLAKRLVQVAPTAESLSRARRAVDLPPAAEPETAPPADAGNVLPPPVALSPEATRMQKMSNAGPAGETRAEAPPVEQHAFAPPPPASTPSAQPPSATTDAQTAEKMRELKRQVLGSTEAAKKEAAAPPSTSSTSSTATTPAPSSTSSTPAPAAQSAPAPAAAKVVPPARAAQSKPAPVALTIPPPALAEKSSATRTPDELARQDRDASADLPPRTVCGVVKDAAGHPVAGAMITAADASGSAKTNRQGRFCIELSGGAHMLQLLCFGFHTGSVQVPADAQGELNVTMERVGVLAGGAPAAPAGPSLASGLTSTPEGEKLDLLAGSLGGDAAALKVLPDTLRVAAEAAARAQVEARKLARAGSYDAVASSWERLLPSAKDPRTEIEVRARIAECRYRAWQIGQDHKRSERAMNALTAFIARASNPEQRATAARWIDSIH